MLRRIEEAFCMQKYTRRIVSGMFIVAVIYVVLIFFLNTDGQFGDGLFSALSIFPLWIVPLLCLTQVGAGFFRFLEWHYYLGVISARERISLYDSAIIFVASLVMVISPGKVAELLKAVLLKMRTEIPVAVSAPVVVAERVVDGLAVIVTMFFTLLLAGDMLALGEYRAPSEMIIFTSAAIIFAGLIVVQSTPLAYFFLSMLGKVPILRRLSEPLTTFYESSREIFKLKHVIPTTIMGLGVYMSSTMGFLLVLYGFDLVITWQLFWQVAFIVGFSSAVGAVSFVPNGAGVTEVTNLGLLIALVAPENPELTPAVAGAAALLQGFFHKWFRVFVGAGVAVIYRRRLFTADLEEELSMSNEEKESDPALAQMNSIR
jgi:hypothetical protein